MKTKRNVSIKEFNAGTGPILDVRSPVEFAHGHIPEAQNIPLLSDEERAQIGICYKQNGRDEAILLGFEIIGPGLGDLVRSAVNIAPEKTVRIHCARGGMRSRSFAWCLETAGFNVASLDGGYKSYRKWAKEIVATPRAINILGGLTGTGKTRILKKLREQGNQVLDLEGLANHRGSSFGGLGKPDQPTSHHFENLIADTLSKMDPDEPVWIEAESGRIGNCWIPEELFGLMKAAPSVEIVRPIDERLDILTEMYGDCDHMELIEATKRITKRLGGERAKAAIDLIDNNDLREACRIILDYYDRSYNSGNTRIAVCELDVKGLSAGDAAIRLTKKTSALLQEFSVFSQV